MREKLAIHHQISVGISLGNSEIKYATIESEEIGTEGHPRRFSGQIVQHPINELAVILHSKKKVIGFRQRPYKIEELRSDSSFIIYREW